MAILDPARWLAVTPYLDQALAQPDAERESWMGKIREQDPEMAADLRILLDEHRALIQEGFLESSPGQPALAGQMIGAYQLVSPIGRGGMGMVWLAERSDGRFQRRAAVKFLNTALLGSGGEERFKREGRILARLAHPHIAQLIDAGVTAAGQPYLVLEHVDGEEIDRYCDRHALDISERLRLFLDVLGAVTHAHANLVVHRDIKPSNVLVGCDGQVKLLDFGIAKLLENEGTSDAATILSRDGGAALTPAYAAPEQITGEPVSTATDVYALGVLFYVLTTGQHPAGSGPHSAADLVRAIVENVPRRLSDVVKRGGTEAAVLAANAASRATTPDKLHRLLRGDLDTIVAKTLKKDPKERYVSVTALSEDLRRYLRREPIGARPDTLAYRSAKFVRRNRTGVALAMLAFLAILAGLAAILIQARSVRLQRDFAWRQLSRAEAISDLNAFLLSDAAPSGKPFTVNELLERAESIVGRQRGDEESRVELLVSLGRQYWSQDENARALRVLEEAYRRSRALTEPSVRAKSACALASALGRGEDIPRAEALIQEGLQELPDEPKFALDRAFCLLRGSEVARERNASEDAITRVQAAQRLLQESPYRSQLLELRAFMDLAESYRIAGRQRDADAAFEQASALLTSLGRDDTQTAGTLFNNWGLALNQLGRPLEAEKVYRRAINISRADGTDQAVSPMLLINYARALRELGRFDEAADYAERGYAKAQQAGHRVVINQSLLLRAWIYLDRRDVARAAAMLAEVEPDLRRTFPAGHIALASLQSYQSLLAEGRGDFEIALKLANQTISDVETWVKTGGQNADFLPTLLVRRSAIQLALRRAENSEEDAARALSLLQEAAPPGTLLSTRGRACLALGRALHEQGKREEARAALRSAIAHLQDAVGPDHPDTRSARQLAGEEIQAQ